MAKPIIITSIGFKKHGQVKSLRELCKYLQYRDGSVRREAFLGPEHHYPEDVSDYARPEHRDAKWIDRGMGETYKQIANRAFDWQGRQTLARTWVISPDPELMKSVPASKRFEIVRHVTERTVERWYSDNGWGQAEYSYVIHDKHRAADGAQMAHAHVITPATIRVDEPGELGRIDHRAGKAHIWDLHQTAAETFEIELGRVLGRERAREIIAERNARLERERDPGRDRRERFQTLRAMADVMQLLEMQRGSRKAKTKQKQRLRDSRQRQAELRIYMRYVNEDQRTRRQADYRRLLAIRREEREVALDRERGRHRGHVADIIEQGRRIPTHAELREREEESRRALQVYFAGLLAERDLERERSIHSRSLLEIER